jgi:hypothetical protein
MHKPVLLTSLLASILLVPTLAAADEPGAPAALGKQGTFVIGSDVKGVLTRFSTDTTSGPLEATTTITTVELEPAIDYFVVDKVSLGLRLLYNYETSKTESDDFPQLELESSETTLGVGVRVGVHHRLASRVSLWARLGAAYNTTDEDDDGEESTVSGSSSTRRRYSSSISCRTSSSARGRASLTPPSRATTASKRAASASASASRSAATSSVATSRYVPRRFFTLVSPRSQA